MLKQIKFWLDNARYVSLPQSLLPCLLAISLASGTPDFSWGLSLLAVVGVVLAHFGMNLADDYFDYKKDNGNVREVLADAGMRSRIAKCSYLTSGKTTVKALAMAIAVYLFLASICGGLIFYFRGMNVLYVALIAGFLGINYSGLPLRLSYYGLGELLIGIMFGPLLMVGVYLSASGEINDSVIAISCAVGCLVMNIVYTHAIMDLEPDKAIGKMTLARLFVHKVPMLIWSALCMFAPFVIISALVYLGMISYWNLFVLLLLPMAIGLYISVCKFAYNKPVELKPKWWMGPMELWDKITEAGIEWFMIRWYMCRNLVTFFCIILIVVNFIV